MTRTITVNRAPVLSVWAAVVAGWLGFDRDLALSLGDQQIPPDAGRHA